MPMVESDVLFDETYAELRRIAGRYFRRERGAHTLQPTALVNEAYLRLSSAGQQWDSRAHFTAAVARAMRRALVDCARARGFEKRGGNRVRVTLHEGLTLAFPEAPEILDLDRALVQLESFDPRKTQIVELRVFGGMTVPESAAALGISPSTVDREWRAALAWLARFLSPLGSSP